LLQLVPSRVLYGNLAIDILHNYLIIDGELHFHFRRDVTANHAAKIIVKDDFSATLT